MPWSTRSSTDPVRFRMPSSGWKIVPMADLLVGAVGFDDREAAEGSQPDRSFPSRNRSGFQIRLQYPGGLAITDSFLLCGHSSIVLLASSHGNTASVIRSHG